jgi:ribosomal protein L29
MAKQIKVSTGKDRSVKPGKLYTPKAGVGIPKAKDINEMSSVEIREHLAAIKVAQMSLDAKNARGEAIENNHQIRNNRRTVARMKTILIKRGERCV